MADVFDLRSIERAPFSALLGLKIESAANGEARVRMPFRLDLLNEGGPQVPIHGGAIASLIDTESEAFRARDAHNRALVEELRAKTALAALGGLREDDFPAGIALLEQALAEVGDDPARTAGIQLRFDIRRVQILPPAISVGAEIDVIQHHALRE